MKNLIALASLVAAATAANAANISLASVVDPVSSSGYSGAGIGSYDDVAGSFTIGGHIDGTGASTYITSGTVTGPSSFSATLTLTTIGGVTSFSFFGLPTTTVAGGFPTGYDLNFFHNATLVAKGAINAGTFGVAVPEPQTYALAAGAALLGFAAFRRARR